MIPQGGLTMTCRRCQTQFTAMADGKVLTKPELSDEPPNEPTLLTDPRPVAKAPEPEVADTGDSATTRLRPEPTTAAEPFPAPPPAEVLEEDSDMVDAGDLRGAGQFEESDAEPTLAVDPEPTVGLSASMLTADPEPGDVTEGGPMLREIEEAQAIEAARPQQVIPNDPSESGMNEPTQVPAEVNPLDVTAALDGEGLDGESLEAEADIYAQVEKGILPKQQATLTQTPQNISQPVQLVSKPSPKPLVKPSVDSLPEDSAPFKAGLRDWAEKLNRSPWPIRYSLMFLPLVLGIFLFAAAARKNPDPIAVDIQPQPQAAAILTQKPGESATEESTKSADAALAQGTDEAAGGEPVVHEPDLPPAFEDVEAPDGFGYARSELRLRTKVGGRKGSKVSAGTLLRILEAQQEWLLVLKEPQGPVGFVAADSLDDKKPLVAVAKEFAFSGCRGGKRAKAEQCLSQAETSLTECQLRCGDPMAPRCAAACNLAFEDCQRSCRQSRKKGRRRRRR